MTPTGRTANKFMKQRELSHKLIVLYQQKTGELWFEDLASMASYTGKLDEIGIREHLIKQEPNQLQCWLDVAKLELGDYERLEI